MTSEQQLRELRGTRIKIENKFGGVYTGITGSFKMVGSRKKVALAKPCIYRTVDGVSYPYTDINHPTRWFYIDDITILETNTVG